MSDPLEVPFRPLKPGRRFLRFAERWVEVGG